MEKPILNLKTVFDYIEENHPYLLFWDGVHKHEERNKSRAYKHRQGMPNEIRIEFDSEDRAKNWWDINDTAINLWKAGYQFAIYFVEGGRGPHLHMYDCDELNNIDYEKRRVYREKFLRKYCPKNSNPDFGLCDEKHLCALEFVPHFKHKKPKRLLSYFYQGPLANQGCDFDIIFEITNKKKGKIKIGDTPKKNKILGDVLKDNVRNTIISSLNFETVFDRYEIKYRGKMALCPFHADSNYSLSFSNEKGLWKCWGTGCEKKGDIISLIKYLKEEDEKNDNKKRS